jgi:hypothetical protein
LLVTGLILASLALDVVVTQNGEPARAHQTSTYCALLERGY